ncbi:MAG: glycerophosphodiester phosphodiesterase family protein [Rectinemataceae bacterium]
MKPAHLGQLLAVLAGALLACAPQERPQTPPPLPSLPMEELMTNEHRPLVIAHRGFRGIAPENTLLAARRGFETGADMWELDVAASSDGTLVVIHDDTLVRTTNAAALFPGRSPWSVYDFTLEELRSLDAGSWYGVADPFKQVQSGRVSRDELASFKGLQIPTLREALELTRELGWRVNIEIKDATGRPCDEWIVERTAELVRELGMTADVLVSSFNHEYLRRMKKAAPEIAIAALIDKPIDDPVGRLRDLGAVALNPNFKYLDRATVEKVRNAGFGVLPWTVNAPADMARLLEWGVTGLITDFPDEGLRQVAAQ